VPPAGSPVRLIHLAPVLHPPLIEARRSGAERISGGLGDCGSPNLNYTKVSWRARARATSQDQRSSPDPRSSDRSRWRAVAHLCAQRLSPSLPCSLHAVLGTARAGLRIWPMGPSRESLPKRFQESRSGQNPVNSSMDHAIRLYRIGYRAARARRAAGLEPRTP
jgi:hypothetical protein